MRSRIKIIERKPTSASRGIVAPEAQTRIAGFEIGSGKVAFHPEEVNLSRETLWPLMMASLGISNSRIARSLYMSENTVEAHIRRGIDTLELPRHRSALTRHLFDIGVYNIENTGDSLALTPNELKVVEDMSRGLTTKEIAIKQAVTDNTVDFHLTSIGQRNNLRGREEVILASIVSGELGNYALKNTIEGIGPREALSFPQVLE